MQAFVRSFAFMSLVFPGLLGCQSVKTAPERGSQDINTKAVLPVPAARQFKGASGVLLAYELQGAEQVVGESGCRLRVVNNDTRKSYFASVKLGEVGAYQALEPGNYRVERIGCGLTAVWDLADLFVGGFKVVPDHVSYIGKLSFLFQGKNLDAVRKVGRIENANSFMQVKDLAPLETVGFVSGFTGQVITPAMADGDLRDGFDVFIDGTGQAQKVLEPLMAKLRGCAVTATAKDPMRLGKLFYTANYKQGKFTSFAEEVNQNAMAPEFLGCVKQSLVEFQPAGLNGLVRVRY